MPIEGGREEGREGVRGWFVELDRWVAEEEGRGVHTELRWERKVLACCEEEKSKMQLYSSIPYHTIPYLQSLQ